MAKNPQTLADIRDNISRHGYHIYAVLGGTQPRYLYTIGNLERLGSELIFAGGAFYSLEEVAQVIDEASGVLAGRQTRMACPPVTTSLGGFDVRPVHPSWVRELMLGATDHYDALISALQLMPDDDHRTLDTPDMRCPLSADDAPAWRGLCEPWPYPVAQESVAMTNLAALRGEPITEAARWEESEWELFAGAGPDVQPEDVRAVSLGVLLGFDPSLAPVARLATGTALWREGRDAPWHQWGE